MLGVSTHVQNQILRLNQRLNTIAEDQTKLSSRQISKWGSFTQRLGWVFRKVTLGLEELVVGLLLCVLQSILRVQTLFLFIFFGVVMIIFREVILIAVVEAQVSALLCGASYTVVVVPDSLFGRHRNVVSLHLFCQVNIKFTTDVINLIVVSLNVGVDAAIVAIDLIMGTVDVVIDIINGAAKILGGKSVTSFQFPLQKLIQIKTISYAELSRALSSLPPTCTHFDSMPSILTWTARLVLHGYTCPLVRFTYPSSTMYALSSGLLDWTYYGSADPIILDGTNNCDAEQAVTEAEQVCAVLGIGFVLLEFCLPIMFLDIFITNLGPPILKFLSVAVYFLELAIVDVYEISTLILTTVV